MGFITLLKVLKALALFLREMWLRDRTFRQFVHENLSLIIAYTGFIVMTVLFLHVISIVKDQERAIEEHLRAQAVLRRELDERVPQLTEQLGWYKERYYELKTSPPTTTATPSKEEPRRVVHPRAPRPRQPVEKPVASRPPSGDLAERWRRLSE